MTSSAPRWVGCYEMTFADWAAARPGVHVPSGTRVFRLETAIAERGAEVGEHAMVHRRARQVAGPGFAYTPPIAPVWNEIRSPAGGFALEIFDGFSGLALHVVPDSAGLAGTATLVSDELASDSNGASSTVVATAAVHARRITCSTRTSTMDVPRSTARHASLQHDVRSARESRSDALEAPTASQDIHCYQIVFGKWRVGGESLELHQPLPQTIALTDTVVEHWRDGTARTIVRWPSDSLHRSGWWLRLPPDSVRVIMPSWWSTGIELRVRPVGDTLVGRAEVYVDYKPYTPTWAPVRLIPTECPDGPADSR
ncbi:MAG TPA: hypothetical protein VFK13_07510 [Gemmatimonadaceae bacterium]|nr:hypothetical protein [Gemmatimonadaceae bacterium]